jgi:hypothetical protein
MQRAKSMLLRIRRDPHAGLRAVRRVRFDRLGTMAVVALLLAACRDHTPTEPFAPHPPTTRTSNTPQGDYSGGGTVTSVNNGGACERVADQPGWHYPEVAWKVEVTGNSISLLQYDWANDHWIPYTGTIEGRRFSARWDVPPPDYGSSSCQFRGGWLAGSFSEEFEGFEATESLFWGPPEKELRIDLLWRAMRR